MESTLDTEEVSGAIVDLLGDASWYECQATCEPGDFYRCLDAQTPAGSVLLSHHFYEPWHQAGPVIRLLIAADHREAVFSVLDGWGAVAGYVPWDRENADREQFGDDFLWAMQFFQASARLADHGDRMTMKLVHCLLNQRQMEVRHEVWWACKFIWRRLALKPRLWWYEARAGRKWWEQ